MSSFFNWAVNEELLARNPARGLRLPGPINKRDKRSPFDREQLHSIFNAPLYRGCVDGGRGYNKVGDHRPRNARRPTKVAAVALANKKARMVSALMTSGERYREPMPMAA